MVRVIILLILLYISISSNSVCADQHDDELVQKIKLEADTQTDSAQTTKPLNLALDPDIIKEQQNADLQKNEQLLPDIFKEKPEHKITIDGGMLINDKATKSEIIDGAGMSIKVKTDQ